ncbi:MAG TPA: ABC transporter ATP-binding protein [Gaiellaceae bacterium]|nr:ABC transporter ATP-binding protein [Gaiellaceae bacterium]
MTGIVATDLRKSFGDVHAVDGIDLSIEPGETVALLGPNGAGKSTTIDMMLGLQRPDGGTVTVFDRTPPDAVDAGIVGAMLQSGSLIRDLTVRELVSMVASLYPKPMQVDDALELAGLTSIASRRTNKLSGGETQRARFAVAVVADPELLVLDEPTVAMDVEARHAFWTSMRAFAARGKTIVFATHYLDEADEYADRVVLMARGQIVADGAPTEIKARVGLRQIRATLPSIAAEELESLAGVTHSERRGDSIVLSCSDSDAAIRALLAQYPDAKDIEIRGADLDDAFLLLTGPA